MSRGALLDTGVGSGWARQQRQHLCHPGTNDTLQEHEAKDCLAPEEPSWSVLAL